MRATKGDHFTLGETSVYDLSRADVILMRQDPPFDMAYITATHILERLHPKTLVVNDPAQVRNAPEKLFVTEFKDLMPPTLITSGPRRDRRLPSAHKDIILKPLYGNGGAGVFRVRPDDENLGALLEMFTAFYREPGDRAALRPGSAPGRQSASSWSTARVAGAINRVPAIGEARSNMHVGGRPEATTLTRAREGDLRRAGAGAQAPRPDLHRHRRDRKLSDRDQRHLADRIHEVRRFGGADIAALIWDAIERKRKG